MNRIIRIFAAVAFVGALGGCGGGGGGGSGGGSESVTPITYQGNTAQAALSQTNAKQFLDLLFSSTEAGGVSVFGAEVTPNPRSGRSANVLRLGSRLRSHLEGATGEQAAVIGAAVAVDDTQDCVGGGTVRVVGEVDKQTGLGDLTEHFDGCTDADGTLSGDVVVTVRGFDTVLQVPTDLLLDVKFLRIVDGTSDNSLSGTIVSLFDVASNTETDTITAVIRNNVTGRLSKTEDLQIVASSPATMAVTGRIFDAVEGFVEVTTTNALVFPSATASFPSGGGPLVFTGSGGTDLTVQPISSTQAQLHLNSASENVFATINWVDSGDPVFAPPAFTISVAVNGLVGSNLVLQNGFDSLTINAPIPPGGLTFSSPVPSGSPYNVTIAAQPTDPFIAETCEVVNGSGVVGNANVTDVVVNCVRVSFSISVNVTGLEGTGFMLRLYTNAGSSTEVLPIPANGHYAFSIPAMSGLTYTLFTESPPADPAQSCFFENAGTGIVGKADIVLGVNCITPPAAPVLSVDFGIKQLQFSWPAVSGADYYQLLENADGVSGFFIVGFANNGGRITGTSTSKDIAVHTHNWAAARYLVSACNSAGCTRSNEVTTTAGMLQAIGYFKASNTNADDRYGVSTISLSGDGKTLAVGAIGEDSGATDVNGNQDDNGTAFAGAVYVYAFDGSAWSQQAYIKASNTGAGDLFSNVALSTDGNTLVVAARAEDSNAMGIDNPNQGDDPTLGTGFDSGAAYVFTRSGTTWTQQAYIKTSNAEAGDNFGYSIALSGDGNTFAASAPFEDSGATTINGSEADNSAPDSGAVYVFTRSGATWTQQAYIKASNAGMDDQCGWGGRSVALSRDGNTLAVGCYFEDSDAIGVGGAQNNDNAPNSGAVYVYIRGGGTWTQQAYIKASNAETEDRFGLDVALNADGSTLAVGAIVEDSNATDINGPNQGNDPTLGTDFNSGAAYVFTRAGTSWSQEAYIKAPNAEAGDQFGINVKLSDDGNTLVAGAYLEDSSANGVGGDQNDNSAPDAGAVYVFARTGGTWSPQAYVKAPNPGMGDEYGVRLTLSGDAQTLAISAWHEDSAAVSIGGDQGDDPVLGSSFDAGAVYLY